MLETLQALALILGAPSGHTQVSMASAPATTTANRDLPKPAIEAEPLNLSGLITTDDYPAEALRLNQEGTVTVRILIRPDGSVGDCVVTRSSGSPSLDSETCRIFWLRARFTPARDRSGKTIASTFNQRITWRLEDGPEDLLPRQAWMTRYTLSLDAQGKVVDCKGEVVGLATVLPICETVAPRPEAPATGPVMASTISFTHFFPSDPATTKVPPDLGGATKIAQQVSRIVIEADGRISKCEGVSFSGAAGPEADACALLQGTKFVPVDPKAPAQPATMIMTVYIQKNVVT